MHHVLNLISHHDPDLQQDPGPSGPTTIMKSVLSSTVDPTNAFSTAWRMSSSETPCLRELAKISARQV